MFRKKMGSSRWAICTDQNRSSRALSGTIGIRYLDVAPDSILPTAYRLPRTARRMSKFNPVWPSKSQHVTVILWLGGIDVCF